MAHRGMPQRPRTRSTGGLRKSKFGKACRRKLAEGPTVPTGNAPTRTATHPRRVRGGRRHQAARRLETEPGSNPRPPARSPRDGSARPKRRDRPRPLPRSRWRSIWLGHSTDGPPWRRPWRPGTRGTGRCAFRPGRTCVVISSSSGTSAAGSETRCFPTRSNRSQRAPGLRGPPGVLRFERGERKIRKPYSLERKSHDSLNTHHCFGSRVPARRGLLELPRGRGQPAGKQGNPRPLHDRPLQGSGPIAAKVL